MLSLLPWLLDPLAFGFCESTLNADDYGPADALEWPSYEPAMPDSILVVHRSGLGPVGALQILDPGGLDVPAQRIDIAEQWVVLVPDAPLAVGDGYALVTDTLYSPASFDVVDGSPGDVAPPLVPVRRDTFSDVLRQDESCPDEAFTVHEVDYRLCGRDALLVAVVSDTEPPTPATVADLGAVNGVGSGDELVVTDGLAAGEATTVWLGAFDGVGRFRGWIADAITMPDAGTIRLEEFAGDTITDTLTPTTFTDCPTAPVTWSATFEETCASWESTGLECNDGEDEAEDDVDCGCATGRGGAWGAGAALGLLVGRRRRRAGR